MISCWYSDPGFPRYSYVSFVFGLPREEMRRLWGEGTPEPRVCNQRPGWIDLLEPEKLTPLCPFGPYAAAFKMPSHFWRQTHTGSVRHAVVVKRLAPAHYGTKPQSLKVQVLVWTRSALCMSASHRLSDRTCWCMKQRAAVVAAIHPLTSYTKLRLNCLTFFWKLFGKFTV